MTFRPELIDELLKDYRSPEDLMGESGIVKQLTKALIERCLSAELDHHLAEETAEPELERPRNRRNGTSKKTVKGEFGEAEIGIPRDRNGAFEPQLIEKGQTRFTGFDGKILSLYARGMTTRDIQAQLQELYGVNVSHTLVSTVTEAVEAERKAWQNRSLDGVYPIVYFDALVVKVRQDGRVINKAIHLALGVNLAGHKELLGLWITENESSKFWLSVITEIQIVAGRLSSSPAWMGLPASLRRLKRSYPKLGCNCASSIKCAIPLAMSLTKTVRPSPLTSKPSIARRQPRTQKRL